MGNIKKWLLNKRDDIEYKKVKCFAMGFAAVHFDQFLANLVSLRIDPLVNMSCQIRVFTMMTDTREWFVYKRVETNTAWELTVFWFLGLRLYGCSIKSFFLETAGLYNGSSLFLSSSSFSSSCFWRSISWSSVISRSKISRRLTCLGWHLLPSGLIK